MRSRLLVGATGWLLGAVTATAGSLYAVDQLGQGLLAQHSKRVSVAMVNSELAQENSGRSASSAAHSPNSSPSPSPSSGSGPGPRAARTVPSPQPQGRTPAGTPPSTTRVLTTAGGQAEAACKQGNAYLVYVSPGQGYDVHDLNRGPAREAKVTFTNDSGGVVLQVTCSSSGNPVKHVSSFSWGGGSGHDD